MLILGEFLILMISVNVVSEESAVTESWFGIPKVEVRVLCSLPSVK